MASENSDLDREMFRAQAEAIAFTTRPSVMHPCGAKEWRDADGSFVFIDLRRFDRRLLADGDA